MGENLFLCKNYLSFLKNIKNNQMLDLSTSEKEHYVHLVLKATSVTSHAALVDILNNEVRNLIPFGMAICGLGYITPNQTVQAHKLISINFPLGYLKSISAADGGFTSPMMIQWMQTRLPQVFDDSPEKLVNLPPEWLAKVRQFGIKNHASHGTHDLQGRCTSYFAFCNIEGGITDRWLPILEIVVPILHAALVKVIDDVPFLGIEATLHTHIYTPRDLEYLHLLDAGKSKKEIATKLNISEHTVRNALHKLYAKLGVHKAGEAVAKAKILRLL